jgi:bifunctional DNase/RNase
MTITHSNGNNFIKKIFNPDALEYLLFLSCVDNKDEMVSMKIGTYEAQAIAISLEGLVPERPLLQDFCKSVVDRCGFKMDFVLITRVENDGSVFSTAYYSNGDAQIEVEGRPADTIAQALRHKCPIYINVDAFNKLETAEI